MVYIITHTSNVAAPIASHDLKFIEKPFRPGRKTMDEWLKFVADNQFTIKEMETGLAYNMLRAQNG